MTPWSTSSAVLSVLLSTLAAQPVLSATEDPLEAILARWQQRQDTIRSVRCAATGTRLVPRNRSAHVADTIPDLRGKQVPPSDEHFDISLSMAIDLERNRFRKEKSTWELLINAGRYEPYSTVYFFDGKLPVEYHPRTRQNAPAGKAPRRHYDVLYQTDNFAEWSFLSFSDYPVLISCGVLAVNSGINSLRMRSPPSRDTFRVHGTGRAGDHNCVIVRTAQSKRVPLFFEYWVDTAQDCSVPRFVYYVNDQVNVQLDVDYEKGPAGMQPVRWTANYYVNGAFDDSEHLEVDSWSVNEPMPADEFRVELKPGMLVSDTRAHKNYRVADDGHSLKELPALGAVVATGADSSRMWLLWLGLVGLAVILVLTWLWRRRHARLRGADV
jgi:LPXTG-motif cell wall-anchored protein